MDSVADQNGIDAATRRDGRRADARRNHEEVFAAAKTEFAEHGLEATIPDIAARAGVGKATVYRNYPSKDALVEAVAREQLSWLGARVAAAANDADAFHALSELLGDISERIATDRLFGQVMGMAKGWRQGNGPTDTLATILEGAKRQGRMRPDATAEDIRILVGGFSRILLDLNVRDANTWRRYTQLALNALRPDF